MASEPFAVAPGDVIAGRYVVGERIGEGGMGLVFLAHQPALRRQVVIKFLHPRLAGDREMARRFRDEAVAASRIRHPGAVAIVDCGALGSSPYIVMEYVGGRPLGWIVAEEEVPVRRALAIADQILATLAVVHDAGVVHADVKSDNFLVDESGGFDRVTLIDFGLARVDGHRRGRDPGFVSGTPEYLAPELILGNEPTVASDLYAVGVILYELVTGVTPFQGGTAEAILERHVDDVAIPPRALRPDRDLPPALDAIVLRALAKRPEARFAGARHLAGALAGVARSLDAPPRRREVTARSDAPPLGTEVTRLRGAIATALVSGGVPEIADGYVELARVLARAGKVAEAAAELREGIDVITAGEPPGRALQTTRVGRLLAALAGLGRGVPTGRGVARRG